jgi:hypothetical protein
VQTNSYRACTPPLRLPSGGRADHHLVDPTHNRSRGRTLLSQVRTVWMRTMLEKAALNAVSKEDLMKSPSCSGGFLSAADPRPGF